MVGNSSNPDWLPKLLGTQSLASRPDEHVWLSASAGTGKTQVLTARVFRLLLRGVDPGAILCLTFTKAGAAEMAGRINQRLAKWVRMPDADLNKDLFNLGEGNLSASAVITARTLFAKVLEAPGGGIRIQTIHSFCQSLLAGFPLEAGLAPGFRPLETREEATLARETLSALLVETERDGRVDTIDAIAALSLRLGEGEAENFLLACARAPLAMAALPSGVGPYVRRLLDVPAGDIEALLAEACSDAAFDMASLAVVAALNAAWGTATGLDRAERIAAWHGQSPAERAMSLDALHTIWARQDLAVRSFGKGEAPQDPDYAAAATRLFQNVRDLVALRQQAAYADVLAQALAVGRDYARAYQAAKRRLGAVDFDDLIRATVALLGLPGMGDWVRYKLDQSTEHILIDEAQDTNPRQWAIVRAIAGEFFAGEGAYTGAARTLFVVGDFKQAIFGFQGTDPIYFEAAERRFSELAEQAFDIETGQGTRWNLLSLTESFRSTSPVLEFVDAAIAALPPPGLGVDRADERHVSRVTGPGSVTLWPPVIAGGSESDAEGWIDDATRGVATKIARAVRGWLDPTTPLLLESKGRALRPEDVMILVKRRGDLASLLVARLYAEAVPVAGVDRLRLNAPLAVQDLLAAIRFALQPDDDLSLASLLVSPLLGWSQDALMMAAPRPAGMSLWRHLRATLGGGALAPLEALLARADLATPYRLLEELLSGPLDGRRKLMTRLGSAARDPIEELLNAALEFESLTTPSLQAFLDWFDRGDVEIVRDPSTPDNAVRVMTVHGAKGLQAPLVILADSLVDPALAPRSLLQWQPDPLPEPFPIFRPKGPEQAPVLAELMAKAAERDMAEHWRLFYVAATRAEERLVIAGALGPKARGVQPEASWYAAADRALSALGVPQEPGEARVYCGETPAKPVARKPDRSPAVQQQALPVWAKAPAPAEARPPRPLAPSSLGSDDLGEAPPTEAMRAAADRGRWMHALFQRLPDIAADKRRGAAVAWLTGAGGLIDEAAIESIVADVVRALDDPRFAELFVSDALAEAPIAAVLADGTVVSGTVDRLLVGPEVIRVIDFKTGRRTPERAESVPAYHLRQMAAYVAALRVIFPGRAVVASLLYTSVPIVLELPQSLLDRYKPGFGVTQQSFDQLG
ncbi:MAG: double-strand break repair helicase AddA [Sphingomonas sp.]